MSALSTAEEIGVRLTRMGLTLSVAESCTGGLLSSIITARPGCSAYYLGGVVSYSNEVKIKVLNVARETIEEFGAVSAETASEMAEGARRALTTTASLSITGIAGPTGGTAAKPLGTVFIGLSFMEQETIVKEFLFEGSRDEVRRQSVNAALGLLLEAIGKADKKG